MTYGVKLGVTLQKKKGRWRVFEERVLEGRERKKWNDGEKYAVTIFVMYTLHQILL
jgi:hypothetical protein